jgi:hypothetical protein
VPRSPPVSDVVVTVKVGALIAMLRLAVAFLVGFSASVTVTVKLVVPTNGPVGVPVMAPEEAFRISPAGRLPLVHVYGVNPPVAARVWL